MLITVSHQLFTGVQIPLTPWRDHFNAWLQCVGTQLETYLVITFTGRTVSNRVSTCFVRDLDQTLRNQRTCNRSTQQVFTFIDGVSAEHRENEVAGKLFTQVVDVDFFDAQSFGFRTSWFYFFTLTQVSGKSNDFTVVFSLQPLSDYGGIETTGIRQYDFLDV